MSTWRDLWKVLGAAVRPDVSSQVHALAAGEGRTVSEWVREAIIEKMERQTAPSIIPETQGETNVSRSEA